MYVVIVNAIHVTRVINSASCYSYTLRIYIYGIPVLCFGAPYVVILLFLVIILILLCYSSCQSPEVVLIYGEMEDIQDNQLVNEELFEESGGAREP
jgi:hypothetical protein